MYEDCSSWYTGIEVATSLSKAHSLHQAFSTQLIHW